MIIVCHISHSGILVEMNPEDISENFVESQYCKNLKFENFGESSMTMVSPGLPREVARSTVTMVPVQ